MPAGSFLLLLCSPSSGQFLIDQLTNKPRYAYSVARRLSSTYTGSLIRVRRSSDNAELDIGYNASNVLDTSALLTFVGANNAFVTTLYDQSGNARHATQTTASNQYRIVSSGSVITGTHGKPAMQNDSSDGFFMNVPITGITNGNVNRTIAAVFSKIITPQTLNRTWAMWENSGGAQRGIAVGIDTGNNDVRTFSSDNSSFPGSETTTNAIGNTTKQGALFQVIAASPYTLSNKVFGDVTGTSSAAGVSLASMALTNSTIGRSTTGSTTTTYYGTIAELIYWEQALIGTADDTLYQNSVTGYYFV